MKKWVAILMCAVTLILAACGKTDVPEETIVLETKPNVQILLPTMPTLPELESDYTIEIPIYEVTGLQVYNSKGELNHDLTYTDFVYDENGELISRKRSNEYTGEETAAPVYEYDENGRVVKVIYEKVFNHFLNRYERFVTEYTYDDQGRRIRTEQRDTESPSYYVIFEYTYYDNGFLKQSVEQTSEYPGKEFITNVDYVYNADGTIQSQRTYGTDYFHSTFDFANLAEFTYNDLGYISGYRMTSYESMSNADTITDYQCAYDPLGYLTNVQMDPHYADGLSSTRNYLYGQTGVYFKTTETEDFLKKTDDWEYFADCEVLPLPSSVMYGVSAREGNRFSLDASDEMIYDTWDVYRIIESMFFSGSIRKTNPVFEYLATYFSVLEQVLDYDVTVYQNGGTLISKDNYKLAVVTVGFDGKSGYYIQVNPDCEDIELSGETGYSFAAKGWDPPKKGLDLQPKSTEGSENMPDSVLSGSYLAVDGGLDHTVFLHADGTVEAIGSNNNGQCDVREWTDIVQISTMRNHTVGLKKDGTVVAVGDNGSGQCEVGDWTDIVQVSAGKTHTVGLKSDGTVVAVGASPYGECDVYHWTDIVAVGAAYSNTFGLRSDGTVMVSGSMNKGKIQGWEDIVSIHVSDGHIVARKADGTVRAAGSNNHGQCDLSEWSDIVAVSTGCAYTVGLRSDGRVLVQGIDDVGQHGAKYWKDIVYIATGLEHTIGVKRDGTFVAVGANDYGQCDVGVFHN